jgi:drug/metabolite transporter (DMT)-like permease
MALLPDLATAGLYALVVFLLALGVLVIFVEVVPPRQLVAALVGFLLVAIALAGMGEAGIGFLALAIGGALLANHTFERLTTG